MINLKLAEGDEFSADVTHAAIAFIDWETLPEIPSTPLCLYLVPMFGVVAVIDITTRLRTRFGSGVLPLTLCVEIVLPVASLSISPTGI